LLWKTTVSLNGRVSDGGGRGEREREKGKEGKRGDEGLSDGEGNRGKETKAVSAAASFFPFLLPPVGIHPLGITSEPASYTASPVL